MTRLHVFVTFMVSQLIYSDNTIIQERCPYLCRCSGRAVDCSGADVNVTVIDQVPLKTKLLNLSNTILTDLPGERLSRLGSLEVLDLYNSSLSTVDMNSFKGLKNLKNLNISENDNFPLTSNTINSSLFSDLTQLKELLMYGTTTANLPQQYSYPDVALSELVSLETLWLDGMCNRSLGMELSNLTKLRTLRFPGDRVGFGFCNIDVLNDDMFNSVYSITHLYITDCGIQILDQNAFKSLEHLEYLDLSGNECLGLAQVSPAFNGLVFSNLSVLVLNHIYHTRKMSCGVVIREQTVAGFKNLTIKELHLEGNAINMVTVGAMRILPKTLQYVSIKDNEYEPDMNLLFVKELTHLETIDASYQFFGNNIWAQPRSETNLGGSKICREYPTSMKSTLSSKRSKRKTKSTVVERKVRALTTYRNRTSFLLKQHTVSHICQQPPLRVPPIIPYLPEKLKKLDVSNSKLDIPLFNFSVDSNNSVTHINAAQSMLMCWEGPVYGLTKLEYLDLTGNLCKRVALNFFSEFKELRVLLLSNNLLNRDIKKDTNGMTLHSLTKLEVLDISNNVLTYMPTNFLLSQKNLQVLNLNENQLDKFSVEIGHMRNLSLLNLSHNALPTLSKKTRNDLESIARDTFKLAGNTLHVDIKSNYIHCYCVNLDFLKWLQSAFENSNSNLNISVSYCVFEDSKKEPINDHAHLSTVIDILEKQCASKLPQIIGISATVVVLTNIFVAFTVYYYRWKIRYWYYVLRYSKKNQKLGGYHELKDFKDENGHELRYDVYLPYPTCKMSTKFCRHEIETNIEKNGQLRVFSSERDVLPGQSDFRTIGNAVNVSRNSIFVFTNDFCYDERWEIAIRFCEEEAINRGRMVAFCVFIGGVPDLSKLKKFAAETIHGFIKTNAYLEFPDDPEHIADFWKKCINKVKNIDDP